MSTKTAKFTCIVVGGGIAGVTCAENFALECPDKSVLLLTESNIIKTVCNVQPVARYLIKFMVSECDATTTAIAGSIATSVDRLQHVDATKHEVRTVAGRIYNYDYLCLCTGGKPKLFSDNVDARVIGIRDTDSVREVQRRLQNAKSVLILGNGGIASELVHELRTVLVHWVIKDEHIASTFVDAGAAHFFQQAQYKCDEAKPAPTTAAIKRYRYSELELTTQATHMSAALGPDWQRNFELRGQHAEPEAGENRPLIVHYRSTIQQYRLADDDQLLVTLLSTDNGTVQEINCDFIISATGVTPRLDFNCTPTLTLAEDGGIAVNEMMCTNVPDVLAAGDCCTANWPLAPHWFQLRLWTQARQMGAMAARSVAAKLLDQPTYQNFCFELFGHVTELFGFPVVLLGRYNAQGLGNDYELLLRSTPGKEYIKFVLQHGKLRGAILIGDIELAETCENLILNGIDLTPYGDSILDPNIDIDDYFD